MQIDQDLNQLKALLEKWLEGATLWLQHFDFNQDVSLLKAVLEKGMDPAIFWLHLIGVCSAFSSDFLKPSYPKFTLKLAAGGATFPILPALGMKFGIVPEQVGAVIIVFCLIVAILSLAMVGMQYALGEKGEKNGALSGIVSRP